MDSIREAIDGFRAEAIKAGDLANPKAQNKAARKMQAWYRILCATEDGKAGLISLMSDCDAGVRLSAAARCLQWVPDQAESVLEALRRMSVFPISFDAEMTLEEYRKERLSFDY